MAQPVAIFPQLFLRSYLAVCMLLKPPQPPPLLVLVLLLLVGMLVVEDGRVRYLM